jgi:Ca-activated chloride channel family protein
MNEALLSTFRLAQTVPSDVLIVTDGEIEAIDRTIESAKASGHRLFVVGIGSSPAESHLRRLAEATSGACDFVAPGEAVEPAILRMFARLRSPQLTDLAVEWPADATPEWVSPIGAAVFDGDTVNVFALLKQAPVGEVRLLGARSPGGTLEEIGCAQFSAVAESGDALSRVAASLRLKSAQLGGLIGPADDATQLAVAYQLVTDKTNFLLIHERGDEEKQADMPELHKVDQMAPAGWGGTGSVKFRRYTSIDYSLDAMPAVVRRASSNFSPLLSRGSWKDSDIPAFLRKRDSLLNHADPRYWSESTVYTGLTPLGMSEWLRITPPSEWPKNYAELRQIGLGTWVIDWLELTMANRNEESLPEQVVVGAFLYVISQQDTYDFLTKGLGVLQSFKGIAQRLKHLLVGREEVGRVCVDTQLAETMIAALEGMATDVWPDRVFSMDAMEEGGSNERESAAVF